MLGKKGKKDKEAVRKPKSKKQGKKNKKNDSGRKSAVFLRIIFIISLLAAILLVFFGLIKKDIFDEVPGETEKIEEVIPGEEEPEVESPEEEEPETEEPETEEPEAEEPEEEELIVYEAPGYEFRTEEFIIELPGISKEYTIAWVSDVHLVADKEPAEDVKEEFKDAVNARYEMFKTIDAEPVRSADLWPEVVKYLNYNSFDGIVFGGDLMDYCSRVNMDTFKAEFEKLNPKVPMMYVRADHDYYYGYGGEVLTEPVAWQMHADEIADGDANDSRYLEFDDFVIIGINRSTKNMVPGFYDWVKGKYDKAVEQGKAVIIATHVPYESKVDGSLEELSMQVKNKIYYWGGGAYVAYEDTKAYFDNLIYSEDTAVKSVVAGHLHHTWEGQLTENVNQHIFTPAFEGCIGIIRIKPSGTE